MDKNLNNNIQVAQIYSCLNFTCIRKKVKHTYHHKMFILSIYGIYSYQNYKILNTAPEKYLYFIRKTCLYLMSLKSKKLENIILFLIHKMFIPTE